MQIWPKPKSTMRSTRAKPVEGNHSERLLDYWGPLSWRAPCLLAIAVRLNPPLLLVMTSAEALRVLVVRE